MISTPRHPPHRYVEAAFEAIDGARDAGGFLTNEHASQRDRRTRAHG